MNTALSLLNVLCDNGGQSYLFGPSPTSYFLANKTIISQTGSSTLDQGISVALPRAHQIMNFFISSLPEGAKKTYLRNVVILLNSKKKEKFQTNRLKRCIISLQNNFPVTRKHV